MKNQHPLYAQVQEWLKTDDEPSDVQLVELEKSFQDWSKQFNYPDPDWDWEMQLFEGEPQETHYEEYLDQETEDDEDLHDLY